MKDRTSDLYIDILVQSSRRKLGVIQDLIHYSKDQAEILDMDQVDIDKFNELIETKSKLVDELNKLDEGFDVIYQKTKDGLTENKELYRKQISQMKDLIAHITNSCVMLESLEKRNKVKVDQYLASTKLRLNTIQNRSKMIASYGQKPGSNSNYDSYYMDKRK